MFGPPSVSRRASFLDRSADDAERVITVARVITYAALGVFGTAIAWRSGHPRWWVIPAINTLGGLTAYVPALYLWRTGSLPRGQAYVALAGDLGTTALLQFIVAALQPTLEPFLLTNLLCLSLLVLAASGLRLNRNLTIMTTLATFALYTAYIWVHPGLVLLDHMRDGPRGGAAGLNSLRQSGQTPSQRSSTC